MNSYMPPRLLMGAAIVGLVGAAGVFIYEQLYVEKRRAVLVRDIARLNTQLASMRTELESIRELQKEHNARRSRPKPRVKREVAPPAGAAGDATDSEYFTDCQSLIGTDIDMDSEEFYDVPSDEEDTLRESIKNGHLKHDKETLDTDDKSKSNST